MILHAGFIAQRVGGHWAGVLIEGPSGSGKSDLALRALDHGFRLVADDRVTVWASGGDAYGRAPPVLASALEVRGLDVLAVAAIPMARIALVARPGEPDRMPDSAFVEIAGIQVRTVTLDFRHISAPVKLSRALTLFDATGNRRI